MSGWKGAPCAEAAHSGVIAGRCADCGKRAEKAAAAWAASIVHWEQPSQQKEIHHV